MPKTKTKKVTAKDAKDVALKQIDPISLAKLQAVVMAICGLIVGIVMAITSAVVGSPYGAASIVILPVLYGLFGFVSGVIGAFIYNAIASRIGGIKLRLE